MPAKRVCPKSNNEKPAKQAKLVPESDCISFITCTKDGKYEVSKQAVDFLNKIDEPVGVIAVAGRYRTGKSFLLNHCILQCAQGAPVFSVAGSVQACTKGILMSKRCIQAKNGLKVIVLDTEGLCSLSANASHDARVFALTVLLSSYFCFNSVGQIDSQALNSLAMVANISKHVKLQSGSASDEEDLGKMFPYFRWVLRDFMLELKDKNNKEITPDKYLENTLAVSKDNSTESTRAMIRKCFPKRGCSSLVRPCADDEHLRLLGTSDGSSSQIRKEFTSGLQALRKTIMDTIQVKSVCGTPVTGKMLGKLAETYVDAINQGTVPAVRDSWVLVTKDQCKQVFDQVLSSFKRESESISLPCKQLAETAKKLTEKHLQSFLSKAMHDPNGEYEKLLLSTMENICQAQQVQNERSIVSYVEKAVKQMEDALCDVLDTEKAYGTYSCLLEDVRTRTGLDNPLAHHFALWLKKLHENTQKSARQENQILREKVDDLERTAAEQRSENLQQLVQEQSEQLKSMSAELSLQKETHSTELASMKESHEKIRLNLNRDKEIFENKLSEMEAMRERLEDVQRLVENNAQLEMTVKKVSSERDELEDELSTLKNDMAAQEDAHLENISAISADAQSLVAEHKRKYEAQLQASQEELQKLKDDMNHEHAANRKNDDERTRLAEKVDSMKADFAKRVKQMQESNEKTVDALKGQIGALQRDLETKQTSMQDIKIKSAFIEAKYEDARERIKNSDALSSISKMNTEIEKVKVKLLNAEEKSRTYRKELEIVESRSKLQKSELQELQREHKRLKNEHSVLQIRLGLKKNSI